jgi:hypothetical protein
MENFQENIALLLENYELASRNGLLKSPLRPPFSKGGTGGFF